ncbi:MULTISPECIES: endonuclease/exonuclease/phosphatase family protein [Ralstonia]|jgi:endonuclease/exonuclease/phosphatase family metal-dependent hydrolase|uniref:Endonuclease/exonuclease/phosphatase domain-containing protein n=3 Tax=Ralstonia TaxID=48736 RepID=A0AAD2BSB9_9RALS|nr:MULTISPECIES: endonuclease/exonuclease/phosphatase family protein [Ralstonia]MEA3270311.1 endonuclease/exonuclease/phosphatase family protein [Pseudomonadota bacterium]ENZ79744.1 metal-dependent hydrolase [Ralstonia pickettii OR214]MBB0026751.1 EEP domain-containing protein [Ralstonia pickettii]MBB0037503.1 EEP domain-containing protein [Ralstonia pickettii]MBB0099914.1 EEP domain-containing protein [Ralstonia pickettii]
MGTVILTWNIQWGRGADGHVSLARQLKQGREMAEFDVLCLQEVTSGFSDLPGQPGADQWSELAEALGSEYTVIGGFALERHNGAHVQRFGNAIATRLPVHYIQRHALPCPPDATPCMPRMAIEAVVQAPFGVLRIVTTHLEYYSELQRVAQIDALRAIHTEGCARANQPATLGAEPEAGPFRPLAQTKATIICGDFNCKADSMPKRLATAPFAREPALHDAWEIAHGATPQPPTFGVYDRADWTEPAYACDFMLISEPLKPRVLRLEINSATQASDHQPMLLALRND